MPDIPAPVAALATAGGSPNPASSGSGTTQTVGTGGTIAPTDLASQLIAAAAGNAFLVNGNLNPDQWNFYRNNLYPPALTPAQFSDAFKDFDMTQPISAAAFVNALHNAGLAGLGAMPRYMRTPRGIVRIA